MSSACTVEMSVGTKILGNLDSIASPIRALHASEWIEGCVVHANSKSLQRLLSPIKFVSAIESQFAVCRISRIRFSVILVLIPRLVRSSEFPSSFFSFLVVVDGLAFANMASSVRSISYNLMERPSIESWIGSGESEANPSSLTIDDIVRSVNCIWSTHDWGFRMNLLR